VTRDRLIVSGETSRGYYIFQLAKFGPDHGLAQPRRSGGVVRKSQAPFAIAKWIARKTASHV
jgi:hypothetical protein